MRVLVVNAGSTTLKLALLDGDVVVARDHDGGLETFAASLERVDAVGHRVVHGGDDLVHATLADDEVERRIEALTPLAPLHQPTALAGIRAARAALPGVPQYACFDTGFHATLPPAASTYALPAEWRQRWPLRRYGFHGLSHAYAARRAAALVGRPLEQMRVVTCHLGAGASLCAIAGGRSVDTTMGYTPLEGLVMATRSGSVDPGLVLWLLQHGVGTAAEVERALDERSGLLGLAGTADMQEVLARGQRGEEQAALALDVYGHRLAREVAAMTVAAGGLDALVFTGGVGEHAPGVRAGTAARLGFLGVELDPGRNDSARGDDDIGAPGAAIRMLVVEAREDLEIARQVREVAPPS